MPEEKTGLSKPTKTIEWEIINTENYDFETSICRVKTSSFLKNGKTTYFYCKGRKVFNCLRQVRADYDELNSVKCLATAFEHSNECKNFRLSKQSAVSVFNSKIIMNKIFNLFDSGISRPKELQKFVSKDLNLEIPIKKVYSLTGKKRKEVSMMNIEFSNSDLEALCKSYEPTNNSSKPYIIAHSLSPLRIFVTSDEQLINLSKSGNLHLDATYKLNVYNFPTIILGFSDNRRNFFCTGIVFTENEDTETYEWILTQIKSRLRLKGLNLNYKNVIADSAAQISKFVFSESNDKNTLRTNCWAHIFRLMKTSFELIKEKNMREQATKEIKFLQALTSNQLFDEGLILFQQKYSQFSVTRSFINDFLKRFVDTNSNWHESYDIFNPSTNNCLEGFNLSLKSTYFNWKRIGIKEFIETSLQVIEKSASKAPSFQTIFYETADCKNIDYHFKLIKNDNKNYFYFVSLGTEIDSLTIEKFFTRFTIFDEFHDFYSKIVFITTSVNIENWKDLYCSCFSFSKQRKCIHVFNFLRSRNLLSLIELNALSVKKQRGRPKQIKPGGALKRDT